VRAHLYNLNIESGLQVNYWRKRNFEDGFVIHNKEYLWGIEVTSGVQRYTQGMEMFINTFPMAQTVTVEHRRFSIHYFLKRDPNLFKKMLTLEHHKR
jgi:predicted AAA+ superfamily ATPase